MAWVVDTGSFRYVAPNSHADEARMADKAMTDAKCASSWSSGTMPLPMVSMTRFPNTNAPARLHVPTITTASRTVRTLAPTAVPMELAASFAPSVQPDKTAARKINAFRRLITKVSFAFPFENPAGAAGNTSWPRLRTMDGQRSAKGAPGVHVLYFAYGSCMSPEDLARHVREFEVVGPAEGRVSRVAGGGPWTGGR